MTLIHSISSLRRRKPIIVGIYPTGKNPIRQMVEEITLLATEGIDAFYIENVNQTRRDLIDINVTLDIVSRNEIPIVKGTNILPNMQGDEFKTAYTLAKDYGLDFIILDMIAGTHTIDGKDTELQVANFQRTRRSHRKISIFGSINPAYGPLKHPERLQDYLRAVSARSDALIVRTQGDEPQVPLERVFLYAGYANHKPIFIGSKLTPNNIATYLPVADGFLVGQGLRENGNLSREKMRAMKFQRDDYLNTHPFTSQQ